MFGILVKRSFLYWFLASKKKLKINKMEPKNSRECLKYKIVLREFLYEKSGKIYRFVLNRVKKYYNYYRKN